MSGKRTKKGFALSFLGSALLFTLPAFGDPPVEGVPRGIYGVPSEANLVLVPLGGAGEGFRLIRNGEPVAERYFPGELFQVAGGQLTPEGEVILAGYRGSWDRQEGFVGVYGPQEKECSFPSLGEVGAVYGNAHYGVGVGEDRYHRLVLFSYNLERCDLTRSRQLTSVFTDHRLRGILPTLGGFLIYGTAYDPERLNRDFWFAWVSETGELLWERTFGGEKDEEVLTFLPTPDGAVFAGLTYSFGTDQDAWIVQVSVKERKWVPSLVIAPGQQWITHLANTSEGVKATGFFQENYTRTTFALTSNAQGKVAELYGLARERVTVAGTTP